MKKIAAFQWIFLQHFMENCLQCRLNLNLVFASISCRLINQCRTLPGKLGKHFDVFTTSISAQDDLINHQ